MSVGKLVIRSTTKMSLHDRFTQLDYQVSPSLLLLDDQFGNVRLPKNQS